MQINTRTYSKYIDINVSIGNASHELGFHDINEAKQFHAQLQEAADDIKDQIELIESQFHSNRHT